jgi:starch-binding outer membrane protein, SusD/RagB family
MMKNRIKAPVLAVAAVFALSGCDLLDVNNPNNLTEQSVQLESASNGMVNGSLRLVANAVSTVWQEVGVASDELFWTGSRDGWNTLDQGLVRDPLNEFIDAAFPTLGRSVWMAQEAVDVVSTHVSNNPGVENFALDLARAQLYNGMILMVTGEYQEDMTFSDKMEDGPPVGPANMAGVLDNAISQLTAAYDGFTALGETTWALRAQAVRARARMSRVIWNQLNPSATVAGALAWPEAAADAAAVLAANANFDYSFTYVSGSGSCDLCGWINSRGENQVNDDLVSLTTAGTGAGGRTGTLLEDPVTGEPDATVTHRVEQIGTDGFGTLTIVDARLLRLITAEHALATGGDFVGEINALRALDGKDPFAGEVSDLAMLQHERRVGTLIMGLRLQDMYRWGLTDSRWLPTNTTITNPGEMFPIAIVEVRANCHLNGQGCGG